ncbi:hypothetical protein J1C67_12710 [Clostridium gasigenes]|uniref:hypothetical protein n=1 Tax=Clostridium gasigenes TaxID=94869 RepID=UPI0014386506|nr:hypothetical protein [Clostridium gasigenes]NKF08622.1 hypothetical protein [Clostridium gasigenes]QSW18410.1 hypothetical protein J1C67_12710 [Clostridium gasigenes]
MKFGVDVNNEYMCKRVLEKIKDSGNIIVDLTVEKWQNKGQEVFKKVLLANITNIGFYIGIEYNKNHEECKIFYSNNEYSKTCSFKVKESLSGEIQNITCEDGTYLYLIKNMNSPGVYIKIPLRENNEDNIKIVDNIIKQIIGALSK